MEKSKQNHSKSCKLFRNDLDCFSCKQKFYASTHRSSNTMNNGTFRYLLKTEIKVGKKESGRKLEPKQIFYFV